MKFTHNKIDVKGKTFTVSQKFGGKVEFNEDGIFETDNEELAKVLKDAGFEEVEEGKKGKKDKTGEEADTTAKKNQKNGGNN